MSINNIKLGDTITVNHCLFRDNHYITRIHKLKYWNKKDIEPKQVMVIGLRTLRNGECVRDPDYGWMFETSKTFKALLVVEKISTKPFYVEMI